MPTQIMDGFGNVLEVCSISTKVKAKLGKDAFASEAEWAQHVKKDAFHTVRVKTANGEVLKNTVIARTPLGHKLVYKGDGYMELSKVGVQSKGMWKLDGFEDTSMFKNNDWDFGPNMATLVKQQQAIVNSPAKLAKWVEEQYGKDTLAIDDHLADITFPNTNTYELHFKGYGIIDPAPKYYLKSGEVNIEYTLDEIASVLKNPGTSAKYHVGQVPPDLPPAAGLPVSSTSKSVGALTNEDAATMFVKTKDKLAQEAGLNIKAAGKIDDLVYKTIADQAGYTPAEIKAKIDAYKASGKKLSALKKKVLPKNGNPTKVATEKAVNKAADAVKKEELKPEEVVQVWDDEAVAKAYIQGKDYVVANNDKGWTLYTKNPDFDEEILTFIQSKLGLIKQNNVDTAIANYIATKQKLSVLKKQMIKKGELKPEAPTLKGPKVKPAPQETGAGKVGKVTEDPKVIGPKQTLTEAQEQEIFNYWENANIPLSSGGEKIYTTAKQLAGQYGLGDDVLPVLKAVDKLKTKKFGYAPNQNAKLYEKKALEHLKNPKPAGYTQPSSSAFTSGHLAPKMSEAFGELPEDSDLFRMLSVWDWDKIAKDSMKAPTPVQRGALRQYSGSYYSEVNTRLRRGEKLHQLDPKAKHIQEAMQPIPENIVVRRGTSIKGLGLKSTDDLQGAIGKTFVEPGFSSTAVGGSGQFSGQVNLIIQVPKGTKGVWLKPHSAYDHENELLLAANTRYKILKVERVADGYATRNVVTVRVIP